MKQWAIIQIESGEIKNRKAAIELFKGLKDGRYILEVNSYDKRTGPQNRYYFGLVIPIVQQGIKDLGHDLTKDETHEFLKSKFNLIEVVNKNTGEYELIPQSTTRLNKEEFGDYIRKIQLFAADFLGLVIPDPGTQLTFYESEEERL